MHAQNGQKKVSKVILPDQGIAEAQDGADQPELRGQAGKEGKVRQADFHAPNEKDEGCKRQGRNAVDSSAHYSEAARELRSGPHDLKS